MCKLHTRKEDLAMLFSTYGLRVLFKSKHDSSVASRLGMLHLCVRYQEKVVEVPRVQVAEVVKQVPKIEVQEVIKDGFKSRRMYC